MSEPIISGTIISGTMMSEAIGMMPDATASARGTTSEKDMMSVGGNMNNDELDRILSKRDDIQPSSGFAASVMEAVRSEASAPPPIPFPWKRALPVLLLAGMVLASVVIAGVAAIASPSREADAPQLATFAWSFLTLHAQGPVGTDVAWTAAALLAAFASVKLSMRLASGQA